MTPTEAAFLSGAYKRPREWQACPVCQGRGRMPVGFYSVSSFAAASTADERCRTCEGKCIIERPK
jgi:hypothetical protein